jgi:hypothetical protein
MAKKKAEKKKKLYYKGKEVKAEKVSPCCK